MDPSILLTKSLREHPLPGLPSPGSWLPGWRRSTPKLPCAAFSNGIGSRLEVGGRIYDLDRFPRVWIVGAGKAAYPMALAASEILAGRVSRAGWSSPRMVTAPFNPFPVGS